MLNQPYIQTLSEITELLENQELHRDRRRKISHRIWEQNVYEPVNEKIRTTFDSEFEEFRRRRISAYDDYIDVSATQEILN